MSKNILDSRDLIKRAEELLAEFENWKSQLSIDDLSEMMERYGCEKAELDDNDFLETWQELTSEGGEHKQILDLEEEIGSAEWRNSLQLIADSYFEDYAREFAEDIGAIDRNYRWPASCIDWSRAAQELQMDYCCVDYDGETYWYEAR